MPYDFFRLKNIFDPNQAQAGLGNEIPQGSMFPAPNMTQGMPPMQPQQPEPDYGTQVQNMMHSLYTPEHQYSDRLSGMLDTMPQRPTEISGLRKLGSLIVGMGQGPEAQEKATYAPYYREMADWNAKLGPTVKGAELERGNNINERQLAYQTAQATTSARQQGTREEAERRRLAKSEADVARDRVKNEINAFKAKNPNWREEIGENGNVWLVPPRPDMGKPVDTGLDSASFTDLQKAQWRRGDIQAGIQGRIKVKQTPDARTGDPNDARNWSIRDVYDDEGNVIGSVSVNKMTQEIKPIPKDSDVSTGMAPGGSIRTKPGQSATQDAQAIENRIQNYLLRRPQDKDFFEKDPATGQWSIIEPGNAYGYKTGPSPEKYRQLVAAITGNSSAVRNAAQSGKERVTSKGTRVIQVD